tara:strand:+ start:7237 stop:8706 length:1470 start_codon:yes stop_codon:yes gene_type:complete
MKRGIEKEEKTSSPHKKQKTGEALIVPGLPNEIGAKILRFLSLPSQSVMAATSSLNGIEAERTYAYLNRQYSFLAQFHQHDKSLVENTILAIQQAPARFKSELDYLLSQKNNVLDWARQNSEHTTEQMNDLIVLYEQAFELQQDFKDVRLHNLDTTYSAHWQKCIVVNDLLENLNTAISNAELNLEEGDFGRGGIKLSLFGITRLTSDFILSHQEQLEDVTELALPDNLLQSLPKEIKLISALEDLNLTKNTIKFLPPEIGELTGLDELWLNNNELQSLPSEMSKLESLTSLSLMGNNFKKIPHVVCSLRGLKNLSLSANEIEHIQPEIGRLVCLEVMNLDYNSVTDLPKEIGLLKSLEELTLSGNLLASLPYALENLLKLNELHIDDNNFSNFPQVLCKLPALSELFLHGNPWCNINNIAHNLINEGGFYTKEALKSFLGEVNKCQPTPTYLPIYRNGFRVHGLAPDPEGEPYEGLEQVIGRFQARQG